MSLEIERKYLLERYPMDEIQNGELKVQSRLNLEQTYLALTEDEEIRVRKIADAEQGWAQFTHTFKRGNGLKREEIEYEISENLYRQLLDASGKAPLMKTRTTVEAGGRIFEIDEYQQFDLMSVEAEFSSEEEAVGFVPPKWFGREIGSEFEYRNKQLWASVQK